MDNDRSPQTGIVKWLRCGVNLINIGLKIHKLFNKNLEMLTERWNDGQAENSIPH